MTYGLGTITATLWLFLLKAGGRWTAHDVAAQTGAQKANVAWQLAAMERQGHVRRYPVEGKSNRYVYGVTGACKVPRSVTLDLITDCVMAEAPDAEAAA